jgi:hypothetical protein
VKSSTSAQKTKFSLVQSYEFLQKINTHTSFSFCLGTNEVKFKTLEQTLFSVAPLLLNPHPLVSTDPEGRLRHAHGQSLADWVMKPGKLLETKIQEEASL